MPGQPAEMAIPESGLLASVSRAARGRSRAEPPAAARSRPETALPRSCKQQLSFRPKAFGVRGLACGSRTPESCKQQLSSGASLDFGSTSAPQTTAVGILQTTTSWQPSGSCRITEWTPCSPPIRSTNCIACTGPSVGRSVRSNGIFVGAGGPSRSTSTRRRKGLPSGSAKANSTPSNPPSPNGWRKTPA